MGEYKVNHKSKKKAKKNKLNIITWHLITTVVVFLINMICLHYGLFTYDYRLWSTHFHYQISNLILTNVVIYLVFLFMWDIINFGYWKVKGIIFVAVATVYFMFMCVLLFDSKMILFNVFMFFCVLEIYIYFGQPGNIGDKIIKKYIEIFEGDRYATDEEIDMISLRTYYTSDYEPYEVLYEQVGILLRLEYLDKDPRDYLTEEDEEEAENLFDEYVTDSLSLDDPKNNPLHSENKKVSRFEVNRETLDYIENNLRDDFIEDYHIAKNGIKNAVFKEKPFNMGDVEVTMRDAIEQLDQPDMLMTYCLIALYKNSGTYRKFSPDFARMLVTIYIQSGIIKYGDFFYDLIVLLNKCGITDVTDFEDDDITEDEINEDEVIVDEKVKIK